MLLHIFASYLLHFIQFYCCLPFKAQHVNKKENLLTLLLISDASESMKKKMKQNKLRICTNARTIANILYALLIGRRHT